MKYIQIDLHFIWDLVQKNAIHICRVHTNDQLADLLTKSLSRKRTDHLKNKINLTDGSPAFLWGHIKEDTQDILVTTKS